MKKVVYLICFFVHVVSAYCQTEKNKKIIINKNCTDLKGLEYIYKEDLLMTDKELTKYLLKAYSEHFSNTTAELSIVFSKSASPCCKQAVIYDDTKMNNKQLDYLIEKVLKYPWLKKIKFKPQEKIKYLNIKINRDQEGKTNAVLMPIIVDNNNLISD